MAKGNVSTHTRRTKSGGTTTVRQHTRSMRGGRGLVSPGHAFSMFGRAFRSARRRKRLAAAMLGGLALGELGAWVALRGVSLVLVTAGILAIAVASFAAAAAGKEM